VAGRADAGGSAAEVSLSSLGWACPVGTDATTGPQLSEARRKRRCPGNGRLQVSASSPDKGKVPGSLFQQRRPKLDF